jgi:hypothetical protein
VVELEKKFLSWYMKWWIAIKVFPFLILQVDLSHLLASRDQEVRALSSEVIICTMCNINIKKIYYFFVFYAVRHASEQQVLLSALLWRKHNQAK